MEGGCVGRGGCFPPWSNELQHPAPFEGARAAAQAVMTLEHGAPVEDAAFFPAGGLLASVGGTAALVWDLVAGGRPLARLANHQKTVTCCAVSPLAGPASAAAPRLLTGSLDGHVKARGLRQSWGFFWMCVKGDMKASARHRPMTLSAAQG